MDADQQQEKPNSPAAAHAAVLDRLQRGAANDASVVFDTAIARWPNNPKLRLLRGEVLEGLARRDDAAVAYATLLADPALAVWAAPRLAATLNGEMLGVETAEQVARAVGESAIESKLKIAMLDRLLDRPEPEERARILDVAGTTSNVFRYESKLAVSRIEAGDFDGALTVLNTARKGERATVQGEVLAAEILRLSGNLSEAIAILERLVAHHPDQPELYRRLLSTLQRARQFSLAADLFLEAVKRWPHDWMLAYRLNRLPVAPDRFAKIFAVMAKDADAALTQNDRFRFQFALLALNAGEIARGVELLHRKFEEPVATLATPVRNALRARSPDDWMNGSRLNDDRTKDVQIARSDGARATVLLTTGIIFGNLPLAFIDTLFAARRMNVIYLRDFNERAYLHGIRSLGKDEPETIAALKRLVDAVGAPKTIAMGSSSGGFSALRYGALMQADVAVSFSGPTAALSFFDNTRASAWNPDYFAKALLEREGQLPLDLVPLLSERHDTRFIQIYGNDSAPDVKQAKRIEGFPGVELRAVPKVRDHFVVDHMIGDGSFEKLLDELA